MASSTKQLPRKIKSRGGRTWDTAALTGRQIASLIGVSAPSVTAWARRGCPRNKKTRRYDLAEVCRWLHRGAFERQRLPQTEMLAILGVTKPTLGDWCRRGCPRNAEGTYDAGDVVRWRLAGMETRVREARQASEVERMRIRRGRVEAERAEMELAERKGELLPRAATLAGWVARYQTLKRSIVVFLDRLDQEGFTKDQVGHCREGLLAMLERLAEGQVTLQLTDREAKAIAEITQPAEETAEASEIASRKRKGPR